MKIIELEINVETFYVQLIVHGLIRSAYLVSLPSPVYPATLNRRYGLDDICAFNFDAWLCYVLRWA